MIALFFPVLLISRRSRYWATGFFIVGLYLSPDLPKTRIMETEGFRGELEVISAAHGTKRGDSLTVKNGKTLYILTVNRESQINLGDRLYIEGKVTPITGLFGEQVFRQGIVGQIRATKVEEITIGGTLWKVGKSIRNSFGAMTNEYLSPRQASVVTALTFNDDANLDPDIKGFLRSTGTIHIISTSGMHVVMLTWAVLALLTRAPILRSAQLAVLAVLLLFYVAAAGWRPPAIRAMIMILLMLAPYIWNRKADALSALSAAYLFSIISNPFEILDIGLQFSYVALFGLILFTPISREKGRLRDIVWRRTKDVFRASLIATIVVGPLVAYYFGETSLIAPIANIFIAFVVLPIVATSLIAWMLNGFLPGLSYLLVEYVVSPLVSYIESVAGSLSRIPYAVVKTEVFSGWWLVAFYATLLLLWQPKLIEWDKKPRGWEEEV